MGAADWLLKGLLGSPQKSLDFVDSGVQALDDLGSNIRYGVDRGEKSRMIAQGEIPDLQPQQQGEGWNDYQDRADRQASGYLYGHRWPHFGPASTDALALIRGLAGDQPELVEQGNSMIDKGAQDSAKKGLFGGAIRHGSR